MLKVRVVKTRSDAVVPRYAHKGDAGVDLHSTESCVLRPGERKLVSTGIKIGLQEGCEAQVRPRSGLALKSGISICNSPGTIDAGYRGEIGIILINHGQEDFIVEKGARIAQMVFNRVETAQFEETDELDETTRGEGGFGHTGEK